MIWQNRFFSFVKFLNAPTDASPPPTLSQPLNMTRTLLAIAALTLGGIGLSHAQGTQSPIAIAKISPSLEKTPQFNLTIGPQRRADSQNWLMVEVDFSYQPKGRNDPQFIDELTFNYYILLNNRGAKQPQPTLLVGSITHVAIPAGTGLHSVAFVSPRTLQQFFGGKPPTSPAQAVMAVGVTITRQGQIVAGESIGEGKGKPQWWNNFQQTQGYVLNKSETPFAPLFWDYYEALKSKPGGL